MALKSANGRLNHHTPSGLCVCCERALKSVGERNTHNQVGAGTFGKPPARGTLGVGTSDIQRRFGGGFFFPPAGKLLTHVLTALLGERLRRSQLAALTPS
jgi:hypothetical protein